MSAFHFKEFSIQQNIAAQKVGIDSIVLGSWVSLATENSFLDIGAGTGVLALMLAQRSDAEVMDAVEIEANAFEETVYNFENSAWADRLFCYHTSIQNFIEEIDDKYDLIIANPPYFETSKEVETSERSIARQTVELSHLDLLQATSKLLSEQGTAAFVIPYEIETTFLKLARDVGLLPYRILHTKDTATALIKRSFIQFKKQQSKCDISELILKNDDTTYTADFIQLTKYFYRDF